MERLLEANRRQMDHLHSKSTILAAIKAGLILSGPHWRIFSQAGELVADIDKRTPRLFPLNAAGLDEALDWVRIPF